MVIGFGTITFKMDQCHSLKEKRKIIRSMLARIRNAFNVGVGEVDFNDVHQRAMIGFAFVGNDRRTINSTIDKLLEFVEKLSLAEIIDSHIEIVNI